MENVKQFVKKAIPKRVLAILRKFKRYTKQKSFKPYIKKKNIEGLFFDFWIGDKYGRDWYDLQCTDPKWAEMKFIKDHLVSPGDVILEAGAHHGCTTTGESNSSIIMNGGVKVDMVYLDKYIHLNPSFLKIDVEGFEIEVLKGAKNILKNLPKLAIEIHTENLSSYNTSVNELFELIGVVKYNFWVQWEDEDEPKIYDMKEPITTKRVHLFAIPKY